MILTALLSAGVSLAYVGLGTVRFRVATEAVLRYGLLLGVPDHLPSFVPSFVLDRWGPIFRLSARLFFLGCAYTHAELAAHALIGDLPADYATWPHQAAMFLQGLGAWWFVGVLTLTEHRLVIRGGSDD